MRRSTRHYINADDKKNLLPATLTIAKGPKQDRPCLLHLVLPDISASSSQQPAKDSSAVFLLNAVYENPVWDIDLRTNTSTCNTTFASLLGEPTTCSNSFTWLLRRIHPDDQKNIFEKFRAAIHDKTQRWQEIYRLQCTDGTYITVQDKSYIIYKDGKVMRMIMSFQDISILKDLEHRLHYEKLIHQRKISEAILKVTENQRNRLGQELHDNINQILSCAKLYYEQLKPVDEEQIKAKARGRELMLLAIEEIRKLSRELVLPQITGVNIIENMQTLIDDFQKASGIHITFTPQLKGRPLDTGKAVSLFRILQEQLKNILVHSKATSVTVTLTSDCANIQLVIDDNGVGTGDKQSSKGIGMSNIRERVNLYNGDLSIISTPGQGFRIEIVLPRNKKCNVPR